MSLTHSIHHLTTQWNSGLVSVFNFSHAKIWTYWDSPAGKLKGIRDFFLLSGFGEWRPQDFMRWPGELLFHWRSTFFLVATMHFPMSTVFPFVLIKPEPNQRIFLGMCSQGKFSKCFWCLKILFSYANCIFSIW